MVLCLVVPLLESTFPQIMADSQAWCRCYHLRGASSVSLLPVLIKDHDLFSYSTWTSAIIFDFVGSLVLSRVFLFSQVDEGWVSKPFL